MQHGNTKTSKNTNVQDRNIMSDIRFFSLSKKIKVQHGNTKTSKNANVQDRNIMSDIRFYIYRVKLVLKTK